MTAPTWTYNTQTPGRTAWIQDETGEPIAILIREPDAREANEIAALMAAAPRLLEACKRLVAADSKWEVSMARIEAVAAVAATEVSE